MSAVGVPAGTEVPSAGDVIVRCGASFGPRTRIEIDAWPWRPSSSMAMAVIVCVPIESWEARMVAPIASAPSRSEFHWSRPLRLPFSASVAVPVKVTAVPGRTLEPLGGAVMRTNGAWFSPSVRMSCGWPLAASRLL